MHLSPYVHFFFFFRFFSYKVLAELNKLGKVRKYDKTKTTFGKKIIYDAIVVSFNFLISLCQLRSVQAPVLTKLRYSVQHCPMKFEFHNYLAFFSKRRHFKVTRPQHVMIVILISILAYNKSFVILSF